MTGVDTHCPYCALQCATTLHPADQPGAGPDAGRGVVTVQPREFPTNRGGLCRKGWTAPEVLTVPDRLTKPLVRDGSGALVETTWEHALDFVADQLRRLQHEHGNDSVAVFGGGGLTNEKAYALGKFARVTLRTSNVDYNGRFCMSSAAAATNRAFGIDRGLPFPLADLGGAGAILLVGSNIAETMPPAVAHLAGARDAGGLLVVDPRRTATAGLSEDGAGIHLQATPGSDLALVLSLTHVILQEGLADTAYLAERTDDPDGLFRSTAAWWPERAERVTGVPAVTIRKAARVLAAAAPVHGGAGAFILTGRGAEQHSKGTDTVTACINLALALGLPGRLGSGYGCITGQGNGQGGREHGQKADQLPGYRSIADPEARAYVAGVWGVDPDELPGPGRSAVELIDALGTPDGPRALLVHGSNLLVSAPKLASVRERLAALELLVVADVVPSETALLADVVFPVTQWAEEEGTMTSLEGRVLRRRVAVPAPGEVRSDLAVFAGLAERLRPEVPFSTDPAAVYDELRVASAGGVADYSGISWDRLDAGEAVFWPCPSDDHPGTPRLFADRFGTPDGRARVVVVDHRAVADDLRPDAPYYLVTGRLLQHYQSGAQTRRVAELAEAEPEVFAEIHPRVAVQLGIVDGRPVRLRTTRGSMVLPARVTSDVRPDTVFVPFHFGGEGSVNELTNDALDPVSRMPEFKVCAVELTAETSPDFSTRSRLALQTAGSASGGGLVPARGSAQPMTDRVQTADGAQTAGQQVRRAVVLGGGVRAVEAAATLRERGVAVTVVHAGETLLDKAIRSTAGRRITRAVRELGIEVLLNAKVEGTELKDGRFRSVTVSGRAVFGELLVDEPTDEGLDDVVRITAGGLDVLILGGRDEEGEAVRLGDDERYVRAVLRDGVVRAAVAIGAPEVAAELVLLADRQTPVRADSLLASPEPPKRKALAVCRCNGVTRAAIEAAWQAGADSVAGIAATTRATTGCGSCTGAVGDLLDRLRRGETEPVPTRRATMTELKKARHLVIVGGGMVAHRLVEALRSRDTGIEWRVTVLAEEPRLPYDRVALTSYFSGRDPHDLSLGEPELWDDPAVTLRKGVTVASLDAEARTVQTTRGDVIGYDELVLATGSSAFVPPVKNSDVNGCFVYRTIDDVAALRVYVERLRSEGKEVRGVVVGGGLLGLEAAGALRALGAATKVVEFAPRLMPLQVDEGGGSALARLIRGLDVDVLTATQVTRVKTTSQGAARAMAVADGPDLPADVVVFATGVRPRDELGRAAGLEIGERGGVVVDDTCRTSVPGVWAIGEVACIEGRVWGLVAPGYAMAEIVADRLLGGEATFPGADSSTKLKLLGVDVASFGDAFGATEGALDIVYADPVAGVYKKLVLSDDARTLLGGILVGDASAYSALRPMVGRELGTDPASFLLPEGSQPAQLELPDDAPVCSCNNVAAGAIRCAVRDEGCGDLKSLCGKTKAGTSCGSCLPIVKNLLNAELAAAGVEVSKALCEHFALSRAELFDVVRVTGLRTFSEIVDRHGTGRGCDICKPVVASILSSLDPAGHVLDGERATLQDTNDHVMANIQKDGTYSVVPRIPGGEVTPEGLIAIGEVARDFGLYTKITGGQRVDLFGARIEQLPAIWQRLVDAGFESGHAYGKALRTVKSCVGSTWCRYGVQDSVGMAIALELRYRGLRSPHKLKLGVSGCARECAEARGKDVGVIATENGWNLYVGGNGGMTPRHAQLLASDLTDEQLLQAIDRFLMYYIRTGDRLQRTAVWINEIDGGLDHVRDVVLNDSLGIAADLDAAMAAHVDSYVDEWQATLQDPDKLARFVSFVNAPDQPDADLRYVVERNQPRPATPAERGQLEPVLLAGPRLEVRR